MKNIFILLLTVIVASGLLTSCSDMLQTDSDDVAFEGDHKLDNANDSIYSVIGLLAKLQKVGDQCVLMGELRGDLMNVDNNYASTSLQSIARFNVNGSNPYAQKRDFYDIVNNCNYILTRMDTSIVEGQTYVMLPEYAQVMTIRSWAYLQMGLIFGGARYFTQPLLSVTNQTVTGDSLTLDNLVPQLISDLEPYSDVRALDYGTVDGWSSADFFIPTRMLLGDLYLYENNYAKAAENYYHLIYNRDLLVRSDYANTWTSPTREDINNGHLQAYRNDVLTRIAFNSELRSEHSQMAKLTYSDSASIIPATAFVDQMNSRTHFHSDVAGSVSRYFDGDLRGMAVCSNGKIISDAFGKADLNGTGTQRTLITKFYNNLSGSPTDALTSRTLNSLAIYRPSLAYLRYAEAINRLGKHSLAFAVLKYGLKKATVSDTLKVDSNEVKDLPAYMDFTDSRFDGNTGTAARGCGEGVAYDNNRYIIPANVDSTDYVEKAILQEIAAETCFEGNRFFDLLCVSHHRTDYPRFMAEMVASKYSDKQSMITKLMNITNWFAK